MAYSSSAVAHDRRLFWGCFIALIATSFGFIARVLTANSWGAELGLTATQVGEILGAGLWPFAISIILFALVIDRVGYKLAMWFGLACHCSSALLILVADSYATMFLGTLILALGNGTVEAYINPVVASVFTRDKTRWLNILHAGWPGGLVLGGVIVILLGLDWRLANAIVLLPAALYAGMLAAQRFPVHERVAAGVSYRAMLREVGAIGALITSALIIFQLGQIVGYSATVAWVLTALATIAYGAYTRSPGRAMFILFLLVMFPLATTELGVDSWITAFMGVEMAALGVNPGWVLIYTSAIMLVLRFFAGGIAHRLSPLGLLAACAGVAALGLFTLSAAHGAMILVAATLYGIGKTFFWPTTLAVVADQCPRGGALTINLVAGVGMLAVGIVGAPFIGAMQDREVDAKLAIEAPALFDQVMEPRSSIFGSYRGLNAGLVAALPAPAQAQIGSIVQASQKDALRVIAVLPLLMMAVYLGLLVYFRTKGGYKPAALTKEEATSSQPAVGDHTMVPR
jgi:MFS family permease